MKLTITLSILLAMLLLSCNKSELKDRFLITGNVSGFEDNTKVYITETMSGRILDSTLVVNNKFKIEGILQYVPGKIGIDFITAEKSNLGSSTMFVGNEIIHFTADKNDFEKTVKISGSKFNDPKRILDSMLSPINILNDTKMKEMFALRRQDKWTDSLQQAYWSEDGLMSKIDKEYLEINKQFIINNINTYYALDRLIAYKNELSKSFIETQLQRLSPSLKKSRYSEILKTFINTESLEKNSFYYDFAAESETGESRNFSEYFNNQYVLLEFSSPFCGWCLKANPIIEKLAIDNTSKLSVLTLNVDKAKEVKNDRSNSGSPRKFLWIDAGRFSEAFTKYGINATPTYFLFDNNGRLIKKWIGFDENLLNQINQEII